MSNEISTPGTLTLGGVSYNVAEQPELQAFIQQVATAEKNKLYSQFNSLKTQIENLKNVQVVNPQSQQAPTTEKTDINAIVSQLGNQGFVTKNDLTSALAEALKPLIDNSNASKEKELADYRNSLINQNLATCIPDLVKGNTREELDAALKESIRIRASLPTPGNEHIAKQENVTIQPIVQPTEPTPQAQVTTTPTAQPTQTTQPSAPAPAAPQVPPAIQQPTATQQPSPMQMSLEEFEKNRAQLLATLQQQYSNSNL